MHSSWYFSTSIINKTMSHKWVSKACKTDVKKPFITQRPINIRNDPPRKLWIWNHLNPPGSNLNTSLVIKRFMKKEIWWIVWYLDFLMTFSVFYAASPWFCRKMHFFHLLFTILVTAHKQECNQEIQGTYSLTNAGEILDIIVYKHANLYSLNA